MLHRPDDWIPEALDLARSELTRRGVDLYPQVSAWEASESADAGRKAAKLLRPTNWQWVPFIIVILCLPGIPINIVEQHWIEDYGLIKAVLMQLSTPGVLIGFPILALWYSLAGPNDSNDKSSH